MTDKAKDVKDKAKEAKCGGSL